MPRKLSKEKIKDTFSKSLTKFPWKKKFYKEKTSWKKRKTLVNGEITYLGSTFSVKSTPEVTNLKNKSKNIVHLPKKPD